MGYYRTPITELLGKTCSKVYKSEDSICFELDSGEKYQLYHDQDCCESVYIESINGNLDDLVGSPILLADEAVSVNEHPDDYKASPDGYVDDSFTWTFYKFGTVKGYVDVRWFGSSNGYYSESVDFEKVEN